MTKQVRITIEHISEKSAIANILAVYFAQVASGNGSNAQWYRTERDILFACAKELGFEVNVYTAAIAAFSPSIMWDKNKSEIWRMAIAVKAGATLADILQMKFMGYKTNTVKSFLILSTGDISHLSGPKVAPFFQNLMGDTESVTVDRHACAIAVYGLETKGRKSGNIVPTPTMFPILQSAYRNAAQIASLQCGELITPAEMQAITWSFVNQKGSE